MKGIVTGSNEGFIRRCILLLVVLCMFNGKALLAQDIEVNARIDTNEALIGDQVNLTLSAFHGRDSKISWPVVGDTITSHIEVVSIAKRDTVFEGERLLCSQQLTITSFDSGYFVIPPFVFSSLEDSGIVYETEPLLLRVESFEVDTTLAIKDIKEPMGAPLTFAEVWPYVLGGVLVLSLLVLGILYWKKWRKQPVARIFSKPEKPPHAIAIYKLKELETKKLWQQDKAKDYHTFLTSIVREYLEARYGIIALELTTDEIIQSFAGLGITTPSSELLRQMLGLADMVKFAKAKPLANEHTLSMEHAYEFIQAGIPPIDKEGEKSFDRNLENKLNGNDGNE